MQPYENIIQVKFQAPNPQQTDFPSPGPATLSHKIDKDQRGGVNSHSKQKTAGNQERCRGELGGHEPKLHHRSSSIFLYLSQARAATDGDEHPSKSLTASPWSCEAQGGGMPSCRPELAVHPFGGGGDDGRNRNLSFFSCAVSSPNPGPCWFRIAFSFVFFSFLFPLLFS
jgi:hypothetical protein